MGLLTFSVIRARANSRNDERGMALITALLATTILLALGMAIVFSATMDTVTTKAARVSEQAFFAADAGIGIARRAIAKSFENRLAQLKTDLAAGTVVPYLNPARVDVNTFPSVQLLPDPDTSAGQSSLFYQDVLNNAVSLSNDSSRNTRLYNLNGTSFTTSFSPLSGKLELFKNSAEQATQSLVFRYTITVTGKTDAGGTATVSETGRLSTAIVLTQGVTAGPRSFAFSGFGAFFDNGDTQANAPLANGTFSGPVHTNTHFAFLASRSVTFRNVVSQVDDQIRYNNSSNTTPNKAIPTADIQGIDISAEGYQRTAAVPLPTNAFSQEYAVINSTGITDLNADGTAVDPPADGQPGAVPASPATLFDAQGRVTGDALALNLRNASNARPAVSGGAIANGVYISSHDGNSVSGAGIYVQGTASDIQIYGDTNGDQVYVITRGGTTTTVRTSFANNQTTISSGSNTRTMSGVFQDKADPTNFKPGAMLYVNGAISSLRGGKTSSSTKPAVAAATRLTITAQADITITGDLKYAQPVANSDGTAVTGLGGNPSATPPIPPITNVLGIFTNDGNVNLAPETAYNTASGSDLSLEMNAAVVAFNSNTSNDGGQIKGSIVYTGSTSPGGSDRWRLVGSRVQSKINTIGYTYRDIFFDTRFAGGSFAPPFFPGTTYALAPQPVFGPLVLIDSFAAPAASAMSWFRNNK